MDRDVHFMRRAIELAELGAGQVSPNPLVGAVVVCDDRIIGEGWHQRFGEAHAEVNAIASVSDESMLEHSTVYVNLEPCSHHGKTPPCADLLIAKNVKRVVVGMKDPFSKVAGRGIAKLNDAGIEVVVDVLKNEAEELNKRFITFHRKQRPYIILKWARSSDGFIAPDRASMSPEEFAQKKQISGPQAMKLVHKWRSAEDAILIGTHTADSDNPRLNVRRWEGRNPVRMVLDRTLRLPSTLHLFDGSQRTVVFTEKEKGSEGNTTYAVIDFGKPIQEQIAAWMCNEGLQSLVVEGGTITLQHFMESGLWDEVQVFTSPTALEKGVRGPMLPGTAKTVQQVGADKLYIFRNG